MTKDQEAKQYDVVIVGSGINSLVCAALLVKAGKSVVVLERAERAGGCIRSEEITAPGFLHDVLSGWHPLFVLSPAYAELGADLHRHGLVYLNTDTPTACVRPDGRSAYLSNSREKNLQMFEQAHAGDGAGFQRSVSAIETSANLTFTLLGTEVRRWSIARLLFKEFRQRGLQGSLQLANGFLGSCRNWLNSHFQSEMTRLLFAPWILHTGLTPDSAFSGHMGKLIAFSLETAGMPLVKGGSYQLVSAFLSLLQEHGGTLVCNADVAEIVIENGKAMGVRTADGGRFNARDAVVCNVTPTQLYGRLLPRVAVPEKILQQATEYRYGRADMQIHIAMNEPPQWIDPGLKTVPMVHLTEGLSSISMSITQADAGLLPSHPTVVVGQPTALDPSRAPAGKWILWLQLQELPSRIVGDSLGEIDIPANGEWTEKVREQYADRIIDRLALVIANLKSSMIARTVLSPVDLQALNINLVGGDPYSGDCSFDQFFLWRPLPATKNHETPVKQLFQIGASTHPGPGLGGGSGYMVGKLLSR